MSWENEFENEVLKKENEYVLTRLKEKNIKKVYPGHGEIHNYSNKEFQIIKSKENV